jgi:hypothetical protein
MSLDRVLFAEEAGPIYTASDLRGILAVLARLASGPQLPLFAGGASIGFAASAADLVVTAGGAGGFAVTCAGGYGIIATDSTASSFHLAHENATTVVTGFGAADGSLDTIDLLCLHVRDNELDSSGDNDAVYAIIPGTPGGAAPADPGGQFLVLAECKRRAAQTTFISDDITRRALPLFAAQPRTRDSVRYKPSGVEQSASNATWPVGLHKTVSVPAWATSAHLRAVIEKVYAVTSVCNTAVELQLDTLAVDAGARIRWDNMLVTAATGQTLVLEGDVDCSSLAGTSVVMRVFANNVSGSGAIRVDGDSTAYLCVTFE